MVVIWSRYGFALSMSDINQKLNMKGIGDSNSNSNSKGIHIPKLIWNQKIGFI